MNAADVLHDVRAEWSTDRHSPLTAPVYAEIDALLDHGNGQGVAILPDGTLWALDSLGSVEGDIPPTFVTAYRLVSVSAEAGDTDG